MHALAEAVSATTTTAPNTWTLVILSLIAVVPGLGALIVSLKNKHDQAEENQHSQKRDLVQLGANILTDEITRLTTEREQWERERHRWMEDKADLLQKVNHLSVQLDELNRYLVEVMALLKAHSIEPPALPKSLRRLP